MRSLLLLAAAALVAGCAGFRTGFLPFDGALPAPRAAGAPVAFYRGEPDRPHREIGEILVEGGSLDELDALRAEMARKAAEVGADAVMLVRVGFVTDDYGYWMHTGWYYGPGGNPYWGWYGGFPYYYQGTRRTPLLRGIAIVWETPRKSD